jgi:hypothetical protein
VAPVIQVSAGDTDTCAVTGDGALWCWGEMSQSTPAQVTALGYAVVQVSVGVFHICAVKNDGTVWCWGPNGDGELGDGTTTDRAMPVQVTGLGNVTQVSAGDVHSCARKSDGTVWCWGSNGRGQLGDGTTASRTTPGQVTALGNLVAQVGAGGQHTCARLTDGTVWCWGQNSAGQVGDGTMTDRTTPVKVTGLPAHAVDIGLTKFDADGNADGTDGSSYAVLSNGYAMGWGWTPRTAVPASVATEAVMYAPGGQFDCIVFTNGTMWCAGDNSWGQLGADTLDNPTDPGPVLLGNTVVQASAGYTHTCAVRSDGTVWCWGNNSHGQVGAGTSINPRYEPVRLDLGVPCGDTCADGVKDGTETDVDCGGSCLVYGQVCADGEGCSAESDCDLPSGCPKGTCTFACGDGVQDRAETDVDCGGPHCGGCRLGNHCQVDTDCFVEFTCRGGVCCHVGVCACVPPGMSCYSSAECCSNLSCVGAMIPPAGPPVPGVCQ